MALRMRLGRGVAIVCVTLALAWAARAQDVPRAASSPAPPVDTTNADEPDDTPEAIDAGVGTEVRMRPLVTDGGVLIAHGRGVSVRADEFLDRVGDAPAPTQRLWATHPEQMRALLDRMVSDRLLANEARRLGLDRDPAVQAAIERALVSRIRASLVNVAAGDGSRVTPEEIRAFYDAHPQRFHIAERRTGRVIFFTDRRMAERVLRLLRLERHGHPVHEFTALAAQYNHDPELLRTSGELRDVTPTADDVDPAVRDALYAIDATGHVHPTPVRGAWHGQRGYFLVRLSSRRPAIDRTLAESSEWIRQRVVLERRAVEERALVERLARDAAVVTLPLEQVVRWDLADGGSGDAAATDVTTDAAAHDGD